MIAQKIAYDFTANLTLLSTENGGRKRSVFSHYRPSFSFGSKQHFSGEIEFSQIHELQPGQTTVVRVKLLPSRHVSEHLKTGDTFRIFEGEKVVGMGMIKSVDNERFCE